MFAEDGLHPTEPGQRVLARMIADALTPHLSMAPIGGARRSQRPDRAQRGSER